MKVYFTGAECTGKSTLARYVSEKYNLKMITEVARKVLSEKESNFETIRGNIKLVNDYQNQVFHKQLEIENQLEDNYCSDRSAIDAIAYSITHTTIGANLIHSSEFQGYIKILQNKNNIIFNISPHKSLMTADGVRESLNWDHMVSINTIIKFVMDMYEIPYIQIDSPNLKERIKIIESILCLKNN